MIDLADGQPADSEHPVELMKAACNAAFEPGVLRTGTTLCSSSPPLAYGDYTLFYRTQLAQFIERNSPERAGQPVDPDRLLPTGGISQSLDMICTVLTRPGDIVFVQQPSYFLAFEMFNQHGLDLVSVGSDAAGGIVLEDLRAKLQTQAGASTGAGGSERGQRLFLYIIPTNNNPSGYTLPLTTRQELVRVTQEFSVTVLADEVYHMLSWPAAIATRPDQLPVVPSGEAAPCSSSGGSVTGSEWATAGVAVPPNMSSLGSNCLSINSFAKILAPGLRVGWIEAAPRLLKKVAAWAATDSGGWVRACVLPVAITATATWHGCRPCLGGSPHSTRILTHPYPRPRPRPQVYEPFLQLRRRLRSGVGRRGHPPAHPPLPLRPPLPRPLLCAACRPRQRRGLRRPVRWILPVASAARRLRPAPSGGGGGGARGGVQERGGVRGRGRVRRRQGPRAVRDAGADVLRAAGGGGAAAGTSRWETRVRGRLG